MRLTTGEDRRRLSRLFIVFLAVSIAIGVIAFSRADHVRSCSPLTPPDIRCVP